MDNRNYDGILWGQYKPNGYWCCFKYGYQHVYIYEKLTGLKVFKGQVVHHLDGDKSNNTAENLVCMTESDHKYLHSKTRSKDLQKRMNSGVSMSNKGKKRKPLTEEHKRNISKSCKGIVKTEEQKRKQSITMIRKWKEKEI